MRHSGCVSALFLGVCLAAPGMFVNDEDLHLSAEIGGEPGEAFRVDTFARKGHGRFKEIRIIDSAHNFFVGKSHRFAWNSDDHRFSGRLPGAVAAPSVGVIPMSISQHWNTGRGLAEGSGGVSLWEKKVQLSPDLQFHGQRFVAADDEPVKAIPNFRLYSRLIRGVRKGPELAAVESVIEPTAGGELDYVYLFKNAGAGEITMEWAGLTKKVPAQQTVEVRRRGKSLTKERTGTAILTSKGWDAYRLTAHYWEPPAD